MKLSVDDGGTIVNPEFRAAVTPVSYICIRSWIMLLYKLADSISKDSVP